jgi:uncharacterized protein DUF6894
MSGAVKSGRSPGSNKVLPRPDEIRDAYEVLGCDLVPGQRAGNIHIFGIRHRNGLPIANIRTSRLSYGPHMPRYFFHVHDGSAVLDEVGAEFDDLASARNDAIRSCGEMLREVPSIIQRGETWSMWITDQPNGTGKVLFRLHVSASNH